jgi:uncharacterized protein
MARTRIVKGRAHVSNAAKEHMMNTTANLNRDMSPHLVQSIIGDRTTYELSIAKEINSHCDSIFGIRREFIDSYKCKHVYYLNNGEINGTYHLYYPSGDLRSSITYDNGIMNGNYICWWNNGKIHINCMYRNGELHGQYREYNVDGILIVKYNAIDGVLNGPYIEYHGNGNVLRVCSYKHDYLSGVAYNLYENGCLHHFAYYLNGVLMSETYYKQEDNVDIYEIAYRPTNVSE